jgi:hypothetical protein
MAPTNAITYFLVVVIAVQWLLFSALLQQQQQQQVAPQQQLEILCDDTKAVTASTRTIQPPPQQQSVAVAGVQGRNGVFATVIFRAPKWMHLRYTLMIHNALANLPPGWTLQLFLNRPWVDQEFLPWHPGFQRLLQFSDDDRAAARLVVTDLPANLTSSGTKPKHILLSPWFYNSLVADTVLLFSANGAFCGNHLEERPGATLDELQRTTDFCGAPVNHHHQQQRGGDGGTHSLRNRRAVLRALDYAQRKKIEMTASETEYVYITRLFLTMNKLGLANFTLATMEQTHQFAGVYNLSSPSSSSDKKNNITTNAGLQRLPLVVSGTLAHLSWEERDSVLKHCPEAKMIFPSLHEPACFGAHPNGGKCQATICALQTDIPRQGC